MGREMRDFIGHTPPPDVPGSPATAGEQYSSYSIGTGSYQLFAASIHTSNAYEEECRISMITRDAVGTEYETCIDSGVVSQNRPFTVKDSLVVGPGSIRGYVTNLAATSFGFAVIADKIRRTG